MTDSRPTDLPIDCANAPRRAADAGLRECLHAIESGLTTVNDSGALLQRLSQMSHAVDRITSEHAGMAEELLSAYEQLGVVFDVTKRLAAVQHESQVIDLFLDSLRRSFAGREVFTIRSAELSDARTPPDNASTPQTWLPAMVRRARDQAQVIVEATPAAFRDGGPEGLAEAMVGPVFAGDEFVCAIVLTRADDAAPFQAGDMLLLEALTMFCGDLIRNHRLVTELREMSIAMVRSLVSAVDQKDHYTSGHSLRVGYYATLLGRAVGLCDEDLQMLQWSALLHDVGKIGIRDSVLKKEGKLTDEEFAHIKEHPVRSHQVVKGVPQLSKALDGVLYHHERYDGSGYPAGLAGQRIPLQARIIQIADVFDALTSDRSYRPAHDWRRALDIMQKEAGHTLDPNLQTIFDQLIRSEIESAGDDGWERLVARANRFTQMEPLPPRETRDGLMERTSGTHHGQPREGRPDTEPVFHTKGAASGSGPVGRTSS